MEILREAQKIDKKYFIITGAVLGLIVLLAVLNNFTTTRIINTVPQNKETAHPLLDPIKITYNNTPKERQLEGVTVETTFALKAYFDKSIAGNSIILTPRKDWGFYPLTSYTLKIKNYGLFNVPLNTTVIKFTTANGDTNVYNKEARDKVLTKLSDQFEDGKQDKFEFVKKLPIQTDYFTIETVEPTGVEGDLYQFNVIYLQSKEISEAKLIEWIKARGIDINTVKISYIQRNPNGFGE